MVVGLLGTLAVVVPLVVMIFRELVMARRDVARRLSLERLVGSVTASVRIIDRAADGGVIEIVVDRCDR